ncbi:MAG: hypothetical protein GWN32_15865 [Gemmatimonadetes bacterium]|nr:hypothetical protein [Gemmatimonadota bacterium]
MRAQPRCIQCLAMVAALLSLSLVAGTAWAQNDSTELEPRVDEQAGVRVEVVPGPVADGEPLVFQVYFNTHSVDLGFDVQEIARLEVDGGKTYDPVAWEGSSPGGHHRSGRLTFGPVDGGQYMKLTLEGIGGVDRVFEWGRRGS